MYPVETIVDPDPSLCPVKQAKDIVSESSKKINMPYITERWPGGMLTNFVTIRKAVKKMSSIDRMKQDVKELKKLKQIL